MHQYFNRLKIRASVLGNHQQKYIRIIEKYLDPLLENLENAGKLENIHLWKGTSRLSEEMDVILSVASTDEEKLHFLACYYSLQILHLNLRSIDILRLQLTGKSKGERFPVYKQFMLQAGKEFRVLTAAYMQKLIDFFSGSKTLPEFTILGVGSMAHQDDIDIGVIDDGCPTRVNLDKVVNKLRKEMFKNATELHFYLSEHVGSAFYTASIQEYKELLGKELQDFVIISEMLNAASILGSDRLFKKFKSEVTLRYHYRPRQDNKYHEGYLRGILGECRSFLLRKISETKLNPKDDALRMISILILSGKTIFRIYRRNRWDILSVLKRKDPDRKELYSNLEEALTFFEIFRHVYQLYVGLEEEIYLDDPIMIENMELVAQILGYQQMGAISAWDHLLIHYHEYVDFAKRTVSALLKDVTGHINSLSAFTNIAKSVKEQDPYRSYPGNIAIDFLKISKFFRGTKFWDDIIDALKDENSFALQHFVNDFKQLKPRLQNVLIEKYGIAFQQSLYTSITFLTLLAKNKNKLGCTKLIYSLNDAFIKNLWHKCVDPVPRMVRVFRWYPNLLNDFLATLTTNQQEKIALILKRDVWEPQQQKFKELLMSLCEIHINTSHYFKRFFTRTVSKHPNYLQYLKDTASLQQIAKGMLGTIDSITDYFEQKMQLNSYHDLEFLRVGLEAIQGAPFDQINEQFTEFSDNYLQILFDICKQEVDKQRGGPIPTRDLIAIYATGGHAREQAFDDDWDLIVLLNEKDKDLREYCNRIIAMMNSEIISRGTMPHYRFADHFGYYVTLVDDLDELFSSNDPEVFIDKSQILSARMIVGSTKFQKDFEERIIRPHIYNNCRQYARQMIKELKSRHRDAAKYKDENIDIKEGIGGLRDIEFLLLIYKAKYNLREPLNWKLVEAISETAPEHKENLLKLKEHGDFLKRLRDLYRLTVSADDVLQTDQLDTVAQIMKYKRDKEKTRVDKLIEEYNKRSKEVSQIVDSFLQDMKGC
ncbi:hypothetical protein H8E88_14810 [candidate division KSB1 bacterium]|nr:hypothetical protein [candidate division KSB1 bacterium]